MKFLAVVLLVNALTACAPKDLGTGSLQLDKLRGQWVVINYWAQWCKPCIKEIPELNKLDRDNPNVTVLGVNYDGATGEELQAQLQKLGVSFTTLLADPAAQLGVPRPVVLPTTLIIDPEGEVRASLLGPQTLESLTRATAQAEPREKP